MSIFLIIISILAAIIVLVLVIALFIKKEYAVEREIIIAQPVQKVFDYIRYVKNQDHFSVWNKIDPTMKKTYTGTDGTPGFMYAWDSNNKKAGKGEQSITGVKDGEKLDMFIHFIKPFDGKANAWLATTAVAANQTKVKWGLDSKMNYPMNIMLLFMNMDSMLGKDLDGGLSNLKEIMEAKTDA